MALAGLMAALSTILLVLSAVIESNSLFLIAAASFLVGIAIREWGIRLGTAFLAASVLLGLLLAPNKFYCVTFAAMGLYQLITEVLWNKTFGKGMSKQANLMFWIGKYIVFNCIYIPALLFFQELLFVKEVNGGMLLVFWGIGQVALLIYDKAHTYFQTVIWNRMRGKIF